MRKYTQAEIARAAGISEAFMCQLTKGLRRPSWPTSKKLAQATGTDPVLWLEGEPEEIRQALFKASAAMAEQ